MSEIESIDFWIEPPLLLAIHSDAQKITRSVNYEEIFKVIEELKMKVKNKVVKIERKKIDLNVYAIDSSYTTPSLELVGGVLSVISYGYIGYLDGIYDKYVTGEVFFKDSHNFERELTRRVGIRERELVIKLLEEKMRGGKNVDLIIIDGELLLHPLPYNLPVENGLLKSVTKVVDKMLILAEKSKTALVGVVKRVRSRYLSILIGKCLPVNDKVASSLILDRGTYLRLGTYEEILPKWLEINYKDCELKKRCRDRVRCSDVEKLMIKRLEEGYRNLERVFTGDFNKWLGLRNVKNIEVIFYKASSIKVSTKIELLNFSNYDTHDIVTYLEATTSCTGYPHILDRIDEYVRIDNKLLDYVRTLMIRYGDNDILTMLLTDLTNLQKAYLYKHLEA